MFFFASWSKYFVIWGKYFSCSGAFAIRSELSLPRHRAEIARALSDDIVRWNTTVRERAPGRFRRGERHVSGFGGMEVELLHSGKAACRMEQNWVRWILSSRRLLARGIYSESRKKFQVRKMMNKEITINYLIHYWWKYEQHYEKT